MWQFYNAVALICLIYKRNLLCGQELQKYDKLPQAEK